MSQFNIKLSNKMILTIVIVISLAISIILSSVTVKYYLQNDTFWHLKAGQYMVENKTILTKDIFSWTIKNGKWYSHEWGWEVLAWLNYSKLGYAGLYYFDVLQIAIILLLSYYIFENTLSYVIILVGMMLYTHLGFICARPHITGLLLVLITIAIITRINNKAIKIISIFFVFIIWSNIHSSVVFGVFLVMILNILDMNKYNYKEKIKDIVIINTSAIIGSLINPHFIGIYRYFIKLITAEEITQRIYEWRSPDFNNSITLVLTLIILVLFIFDFTNKKKLSNLLLSLLGLSMFLMAVRNAFIYAILVAIAINNKKIDNKEEQINKLVVGIFFVAILSLNISNVKIYDNSYFKKAIYEITPQKAIDYMIKNNIKDNIYNEYHYGGYLLFNNIKCSIDSRADYYYFNNKKFVEEFFNSTYLQNEKPEETLKKYKVKYALFPTESIYTKYLISKNVGKVIYKDKEATILKIKY